MKIIKTKWTNPDGKCQLGILPPSLPPSLPFSTEDIQHWDPMTDDFKSSSFNSYTEGPGALLPSSLGKDENICLYVCNIPTTITKVWGGVWSHSWNAVYMHCPGHLQKKRPGIYECICSDSVNRFFLGMVACAQTVGTRLFPRM